MDIKKKKKIFQLLKKLTRKGITLFRKTTTHFLARPVTIQKIKKSTHKATTLFRKTTTGPALEPYR